MLEVDWIDRVVSIPLGMLQVTDGFDFYLDLRKLSLYCRDAQASSEGIAYAPLIDHWANEQAVSGCWLAGALYLNTDYTYRLTTSVPGTVVQSSGANSNLSDLWRDPEVVLWSNHGAGLVRL